MTRVNKADIFEENDLLMLGSCTLCPRECRIDRVKKASGYCGTDAGFNIASVCLHRGEEPVIGGADGICNIFFSGCNLRCSYCQNHEISRPGFNSENPGIELNDLLDRIEDILSKGIKSVGFVSPSHVVPQVKAIIKGLNMRGLKPITVYNTNSYDKTETIQGLSGLIDVYLPDYKYVTREVSAALSGSPDYPQVARKAIKEMYYQKGSTLIIDEEGRAENGMIIRHLVLPGHVGESIGVLKTIAEELSTGVHLSLMSQYHPTDHVRNDPFLNRPLYKAEYESVVEVMQQLGFRNGWFQDLDSYRNYPPDFSRDNPFE